MCIASPRQKSSRSRKIPKHIPATFLIQPAKGNYCFCLYRVAEKSGEMPSTRRGLLVAHGSSRCLDRRFSWGEDAFHDHALEPVFLFSWAAILVLYANG